MDRTKTPQIKTIKIKSFEKKLHLGFLEFLLGAAESADPATPALDDAVLELIIDEKINKIKKTLLFFPTLFPSNKKKTKTNPPTLRVNLIKNQSLGISERESKRVLGNLVVVVVVVVLNWVFVALFCKRFDFSGDQKRLYFSLSL